MAFGTFMASPKSGAARKPRKTIPQAPPDPEPVPEEPAVQPQSVSASRIQVLLLGRNMALIQDYLCSMYQNMTEAMNAEGLSFYTQERETIADMVNRKKKLEQFFWEQSSADWVCRTEEPSVKSYGFAISPAGVQGQTMDIVIHCATPDQLPTAWEQMDAVWVLTDGALFDPALDDAYTQYVRSFLSYLSPQQGENYRPVCLICSQIEKFGHFRKSGFQTALPYHVLDTIRSRAVETFGSACVAPEQVQFMPVQVYGGLVFSGLLDGDWPILRIGQNGYYQSYIPELCHIPALYTIRTISKVRQDPILTDGNGRSLSGCIQHHLAVKLGAADWIPDNLGGTEG